MRKFLLITMMCLFGLFTVNAQETSFSYNFDDGALTGWRTFTGDGNVGNGWSIPVIPSIYPAQYQTYYKGVDNTDAIASMAYNVIEGQSCKPNAYIVTTETYAITATSKLSWYAKVPGGNATESEHYYLVVSEDNTTWTSVFDEVCPVGADKEFSFAGTEYVGKNLYIGFQHLYTGSSANSNDAVVIDNVVLSVEEVDVPEVEEPEEPINPEDLYIVEIGADKNPNSSGNYYVPAYDYSPYAISQQIYTEEDMAGTVGKIYSVAFKLGMQRSTVTRQYEVYLTSTELEGFEGYNYIALSEGDKVFDGNVEIEGTANSWYTIVFDKPFDYTGGNFVISVYDKTGTGNTANYHTYYKYTASNRDLSSNGYAAYDMLNLTTGTAKGYVSQVQFGLAVDPVVNVSAETVALGNVKVGEYWTEEAKSVNVEVQALATTVTSISCDNAFFTLNYDLTANPVVLNVSYDKTAEAGEKTATITIKADDVEDVTIPVTATAYVPTTADVYELAQEIIFDAATFTHTPEFANLNDDYNLPKEANAGNTPDAVYSFELDEEATVIVDVTGTNAIAAIYGEDFGGEGGPKAKNNDKGIVEGPTGPTTFFFDFNDNSLEAFNLIDADGDGYNWTTTKEYGTENHYAISYSIYGTKTPDNYMFTKDVYSITATSKLTYKVKSVKPYPDHYAIVVSENGEDFEIVFEEDYAESTFSTKEVDLSVYAGKALYIGIRHYNCTDQYYIVIDDLQLTDGSVMTRGENAEPQIKVAYPAGKYYLVAAAEDAFTVNVTLEVAPPAAPDTLFATAVNETSIALKWAKVNEKIDGYNIYQGDALVQTVTDTTYTVEGLECNTNYCFTVTAVNKGIESFKTSPACAMTNDYVIAAPANVAVTAVDPFTVKLTWDAVEYAQSYNIYVGENTISTTETSYVFEDLEPATEYCYEVTAVRNEQETEKVEACGSTEAIDFDAEDLATEFFFDFNDQSFSEFRRIDADKDGNDWTMSSADAGYENTAAIRSYSYYGSALTPDNYVYTKRPYRITATSVVTLNAKSGTGMDSDLGEHYAVVVSENGTDWTIVFEETIEHANWTNTSVSLAEYAGKGVLIGIRHYDCSGFYFLAVDNFALTVAMAAPVVTATAVNDTEIALTWEAVENATNYNVYSADTLVANVTETTYTVKNLTAETQYCFNVTAVGAKGESAKSEDACATTLETPVVPEPTVPSAPVVTAEATSDTTIVLVWLEVENATSYNVYQGEELVAEEITATSYTVDGLKAATEYCFTVTAVNELGESAKSEAVCATTNADAIAENVVSFNVYPNPVSDNLVIETEATIEAVTIYTVTGVMVYGEVDFNDNTINVSDFANGVYIMKVRTENGEAVQRFIKK